MNRNLRPLWQQAVLFMAGIAAVGVIGWLAMQLWPKQPVPEGWTRLTPPHDVMALVEREGEIWAGGRDGLVVLDPADGHVLREVEADVPLDYVTGMAQTADGELWVSHMRGASRFDGVQWETLTENEGLTPGRALAVLASAAGDLWVGTEQGVARYRDGACTRYTQAEGLVTEGCAYLFEDSQARIWCGNGYVPEAGVSVFENGAWRAMTDQDQLAHPMLNTMLETADGALWFGMGFSAEGGLSVLDADGWQTLTNEDGLAGAKVRYLFQDRGATVWVGSEYNGILRLGHEGREDVRTGQVFTAEDGLAGWEVKAMLQDSQGTLWLGTELGLTRMSYDAWLRLNGNR